MKNQKRLWILVGIILGLTSLLSWFIYDRSLPALIYTTNLESPELLEPFQNYIKSTWPDLNTAQLSEDLHPRSTILILSPWGQNWETLAPSLATLAPEPLGLMPSTLRVPGEVEGRRVAYPVAVDQVEVAFRRDLFLTAGLQVEDRLLNLGDLERVWSALAKPQFFPLVVSAGSDQGLTDLVSVLVLSLGGRQAYLTWMQDLEETGTEGWTTTDWEKELVPGFQFTQVIERLEDWRARGILHPEWLRFQVNDTRTFLDNNLAATTVMRLSEHRSWPLFTVRRLQASPFPPLRPQGAAEGLVGVVWLAGVPDESRWREQAQIWLRTLPDQVFQTQVLETWGLAPVNSTVPALDREADDLRFWAAASRGVLPPLDLAVSPPVYQTFVRLLRERL